MAKATPSQVVDEPAPEPVAVVAPAAAPVPTVTLEEFCSRMSEKQTRPELFAAFHFTEKAAGRLRDTETAFAGRLDAFLSKPV